MDDPFTEDALRYADDPSEIWESKIMRKRLTQETGDWIYTLRPWSSFLTLTFKKDTAPDIANRLFRKLISVLNEEAFGHHYRRIVGHSYFSFVQGIEYQQRDVIHFHVLVDRPINFQRVHLFWNAWGGFAWTDTVIDRERVVRYVSKYVAKGGEVNVYLADKQYKPFQKPYWWNEDPQIIETLEGFKS
jgi:hypothetical protein